MRLREGHGTQQRGDSEAVGHGHVFGELIGQPELEHAGRGHEDGQAAAQIAPEFEVVQQCVEIVC